jgi:ATP-dependent RNA helicase DDX31/DBP7
LKLLKPFTWLVPGYLCGGEKRKSEKARLRNGINILVVTPGRMCDHLEHTESMRLDKVKFLVLDEADRLLELGYENDVRKIVDSLNAHKNEKPTAGKDTKDDSAFESEEENPLVRKSMQSLLLSATLTPLVKKLAGLTLKNPKFIETTVNENANLESMMDDNENEIENISIPVCVTQKYLICPVKMRLVTLSGLIAHECGAKRQKVLVFFATQDLVDYHYDVMVEVLAIKASSDDEEEESEIDEDADIEDYQNKGHERVTEDGICADVRFFK